MKNESLLSHIDSSLRILEKSNSSVLSTIDSNAIKNAIDQSLPVESNSFNKVLTEFEERILPYINNNTSPKYAAYITGKGNPIGAVAELIKGLLNQNSLKWNSSPIASELELLIVKWVSMFIGLPEFNQGLLTSGGSMSNFLAIHYALFKNSPSIEYDGLYNSKKKLIYCSTETHSSILRGAIFAGLGATSVRSIQSNSIFQIDIEQLNVQIEEDVKDGYEPIMIIGNAGTTNTGAIDDLSVLSNLAKKHKMWFHVDGAYGIPARKLESHSRLFEGCEKADSISINPHKWMYIPFEAGCLLFKDSFLTIHSTPAYLQSIDQENRWESSNYTIELTKEFRALKIWFTLKFYGAKEIYKWIKNDIDLTQYAARQLQEIMAIQVEPVHPLSILCFRFFDSNKTKDENNLLNQEVIRKIESGGRVFVTGTQLRGDTYLRIYFGNPDRTAKDVDLMISEISQFNSFKLYQP